MCSIATLRNTREPSPIRPAFAVPIRPQLPAVMAPPSPSNDLPTGTSVAAARKLKLLEARLRPNVEDPTSSSPARSRDAMSPSSPTAHSPAVVFQRPAATPRAPPGGNENEDDDVASFTTDGSFASPRDVPLKACPPMRPETLLPPSIGRSRSISWDRNYAPRVDRTLDAFVDLEQAAAAAIAAKEPVKAGSTKLGKTPAAPAKKSLRRKRTRAVAGLGSPATSSGLAAAATGPARKTMKVDEYFKPSSASKGRTVAKAAVRKSAANGVRRELGFQSPAVSPALGTAPHAPALPLPQGRRQSSEGANDEVECNDAAGPRPADTYGHMRALIDSLRAELAVSNEESTRAAAEAATLEAENEDLRAQLDEMAELRKRATAADDAEKALATTAAKMARMRTQLRYGLTESAVGKRADARREAALQSERLGRIVTERNGTAFSEVWDDGIALRENSDRLRKVQADRERLERKRRELAKMKKAMPPPPPPGTPYENTPEYAAEVDEILKLRSAALKREETQLMEDRAKMVMERDCLLRELSRQNDESNSGFGNFPILGDRYLLLNLLGRGGFSEVFRAYDFESARFVACKVHQLASNWSEARKQSFLRHMLRENEIHKSLSHPRILRAHDSFELDNLTVVSVLDLCNGTDLDVVLRKNGALPEREARSIIAQVFAGLVYLDQHDIVHYDLKPGNILLDNGQVRITDFGLSKINTESAPDGLMDLTSQGAGTMWYLPPECFAPKAAGGGGPRISTKVDVWSAAVILFQCLFGTKPFGHGQSQEQFFRENTASKETLQFPARPGVSDAAKDFIRLCLTRNVADRPDVHAASNHPFLQTGRK
jgi:tousled-like kinase